MISIEIPATTTTSKALGEVGNLCYGQITLIKS